MNIPTIEDHKALVELALDEYEIALNQYEIFMAEWRLKHVFGIEPEHPDDNTEAA